MAEHPRVAMSPSDLPRQRLWLVEHLPPRPRGWSATVDRPPPTLLPMSMPASARYLGQVEWAWSPMHSRIDAYHLSLDRSRSRWLLWVRHYDDNRGRWPSAEVEAFAPRARLAWRDAAMLLLAEYWTEARDEFDVDRFHWIAQTGVLEVGALSEVARAVWEAS
jgi:hypothetical protein